MILAGWCWGVNVYVWTRYRINYLYLFDLDPRFTLRANEVFRIALDASIVFLANFLLFFKVCDITTLIADPLYSGRSLLASSSS